MHKFLKFFLLVIVVSLLPACNKSTQRSNNSEEAIIYSLLLNEDPEGYIGDSSIVILNETDYGLNPDNNSAFQVEPSLDEETLENYRLVNKQPRSISSKLSLKKPYELISQIELESRVENNLEWANTNILITFSKVGFNSKLDQALVYMEIICGFECGTGNLYFLIYDKNTWKIENIIDGMVS